MEANRGLSGGGRRPRRSSQVRRWLAMAEAAAAVDGWRRRGPAAVARGGQRRPTVARLAATVVGRGPGDADRWWLCAQTGCAHEEEEE